MDNYLQHPASFRDPSGFIFEKNGKLYRQVNLNYAENYDFLLSSGLYSNLINEKLLIQHEDCSESTFDRGSSAYKIIQPDAISTISYPYEWCFEQLQDAALTTLEIAQMSINHGMVLKDATPYNIQFKNNRPVLIDTLSFEKYNEEEPWVAYRQFCETFLYPLLLANYTHVQIHKIFLAYPEGISASITKSILPLRSKFHLSTWLDVVLPASVKSNSDKAIKFSKSKMVTLLQHLTEVITKLKPDKSNATWINYYSNDISSGAYLENKRRIFTEMTSSLDFNSALDLGCNEGFFSRIISERRKPVLAVDEDPMVISSLYKKLKEEKGHILPLVIDICNPSPDSGFNNKERPSFLKRIKTDCLVALALIHHLCIGKNVSLKMLAELFSITSRYLLIEFIPKDDEKVELLLKNRRDIFLDYNEENFLKAFNLYFKVRAEQVIEPGKRKLFLMEKINP